MKAALRNKRPVPDDSKLPIFTMNKKAIMLKFLVTIVLAIIIFIPACAFVTKFFFRLSAQGEDSFRDLVNEVKDVAEAAEGEQRTFVLKMDAETVVAAFKPGTINIFSVEQEGTALSSDELAALPEWARIDHLAESAIVGINYDLSTPPQCLGSACLCLCRNVEREQDETQFEEIGAFPAPPVNRLVGTVRLTCGEDSLCRVASPAEFSHGWGSLRISESDPRRIPLRITKESGKVVIEELS